MGNFFGTAAGLLLGSGLAKFNPEIPGELDDEAASAGVPAPVMPQETKTLFDRADELLKQGMQSEDHQALIEAIDTYRRGLALLPRAENPRQWALAHTNLAVALEMLGEQENGTARIGGGRRSLSRGLEGIYPRARAARLGRHPDESR
jgi:hypothetical protein